MKKNIAYFNTEERNGLFLLLFLLFLFSSFIFLQKRVLPNESSIQIVQNTIVQDGIEDFPKVQRVNKIPANNSVINSTKNIQKGLGEKHQIKFLKVESNKPIKTNLKKANLTDLNDLTPNKYKSKSYKSEKTKPISINSQNVDDWMSLYGIGPKYAERIVKYQKWLGGFHNPEQLTEVYGITDSLYQTLTPYLLKAEPYNLIQINNAEVKEIGKHPYINWKQAKMIVQYRKHHGDFDKIEDLNKMKGLAPEIVIKIKPYLDFTKSQKESES